MNKMRKIVLCQETERLYRDVRIVKRETFSSSRVFFRTLCTKKFSPNRFPHKEGGGEGAFKTVQLDVTALFMHHQAVFFCIFLSMSISLSAEIT